MYLYSLSKNRNVVRVLGPPLTDLLFSSLFGERNRSLVSTTGSLLHVSQ